MMLRKGPITSEQIRQMVRVRMEAAAKHLLQAVRRKINRPGRRMLGSKYRTLQTSRVRMGGAMVQTIRRSRLQRTITRAGKNEWKHKRREASLGPTLGRFQIVRNVQSGRALGITITSRPGEPPRRQTGRLYRSYGYGVGQWQGNILQAWVSAPYVYAGYLELGTKRMAARPHLKNTGREEAPAIARIVGAQLV